MRQSLRVVDLRLLVVLLWPFAMGLVACGDDDETPDTGGVADAGDGADATDASDAADDADDVGGDPAPDLLGEAGPWIDGQFSEGPDQLPPENCVDGVDDDGDGDTDCDDDDCADRLICTADPTLEAESNNRSQDATEIALPALVRGEIGPYTETQDGDRNEDLDWYTFEIAEPTVLGWEYDDANALGLFQLYLVGLEDPTRSVVRRLDGDTPGRRRQVYLPFAGRYGIEVRDRRNTALDDNEVPYGGDLFDYAFSLTVEDWEEVDELPLGELRQLPDGNPVQRFTVDLQAGRVFEAEIVADRLSPSSGLDAWLYLVEPADGRVLAQVDDAPLGTDDPILRTGIIQNARPVWLVLENFRVEFTSDYELWVRHFDHSADVEPNDPIGLAVPGVAGTEAISGEIEAPYLLGRSTLQDRDYYYFPGGPAASYRVAVTPLGDDLDAAIRTGYFGYSRGVPVLGELFIADPPDERAAGIDAVHAFDGYFYVEVSDRRNLFSDDDEEEPDLLGGGAEFEYELTVSPLTREIAAIAAPYSDDALVLSEAGQVDWFELTVPARTRLELQALEGDEAIGFEPWVYLTEANDRYLRRARRALTHLNEVERAYRIGVVDRRGQGGADFDYQLDVAVQTFEVVDEVEPNDGPPVGGQSLPTLPAWVNGEVTGQNADDYDCSDDECDGDVDIYVINLEAGQLVTIETAAAGVPDTPNADTTISLSGPGLEEPLVDGNGGFGWYSLLNQVEVPESGPFEVTVVPWCNSSGCRSGRYSLTVLTEPAPAE
jgi:hypothetical protein